MRCVVSLKEVIKGHRCYLVCRAMLEPRFLPFVAAYVAFNGGKIGIGWFYEIDCLSGGDIHAVEVDVARPGFLQALVVRPAWFARYSLPTEVRFKEVRVASDYASTSPEVDEKAGGFVFEHVLYKEILLRLSERLLLTRVCVKFGT